MSNNPNISPTVRPSVPSSKRYSVYTAKRLQRWSLTLMEYSFDIKYKPTKKHANADTLSRFPAGPDPNFKDDDSIQVAYIEA
uniref:Uncharacterized protein n=1 Tax=Acrobeloides nanus TaxID=290746 RepID=A0A914BV29_9BILA